MPEVYFISNVSLSMLLGWSLFLDVVVFLVVADKIFM